MVAVDLTISDANLVLDFSRTALQCSGPINVSKSTTIAACYVGLKHLFKDVPANSGVLSAIDFIIPDDSLLAATAPKPVGGYTETILRIIDVIFVAMSKADPAIVNGCAYGTINALSMSGYRQSGERWVLFSFFGGGHGGHPEGDGLNHGNAPISMATIPPLEILEAAYPIYFSKWALRPNSGGQGRYRGGLGAIYEIVLLEEHADVFLFGDRSRFGPPGVCGGGSGMVNSFLYEHDGNMIAPPLLSKATGISLKEGQRVRLETPGGGGYGDSAERKEQDIANDILEGYVTERFEVESVHD
jgi:N-methylhydantoinase B